MVMDNYQTPSCEQQFQLEVKRSRFITTVASIDSKDHGLVFIEEKCRTMPDANHHCWAMIAGRPDDIYQQDQSDDGEPKGTAGKPMLNVLSHSGLGNIVVVVTRYFGGIKLGTGGLVRAYTQSVTESLKALSTEVVYIRTEITTMLPYSSFDRFNYWLQGTNIVIREKQFLESIVLNIQSPESELSALKEETIKLGGSILIN